MSAPGTRRTNGLGGVAAAGRIMSGSIFRVARYVARTREENA
jgi:hypothetical protein